MWFERHGGRSEIRTAYEGTGRNVVDVFREVVRRSATVPPSWDTTENGAGIVNLPGLLEEPLPPAETVTPPSGRFPSIPDLEDLAGIIGGGLLPIGGLDLIPVLAEPVGVVVDFQRLVVRDDGEYGELLKTPFWAARSPRRGLPRRGAL